ncbi:MAG: electron transfer flavoprotein subunit beta/FixA family protein [Desulfitobacterium sp.]|nr:electron transfer flavoprotein subunit beta/FixA family protein [Desulfitobacterium sp.]
MNIVVCIKQTFDTEAKIALDSQGKIDSQGVNLIINPYDEFAIEEGIRLKEQLGGEVTVVSLGGERAQEAIRTALAMGADKGILVSDPSLEEVDEWVAAEVLAKAVEGISYDLLLAGRIAIDDGSAQVAVRLAEKLGVPSVSSVLKIEADGEKITAVREIDGGTETLEIPLPAMVTAQKGLNEPRYPSVAGIMKAKRKPLNVVSLADLGLNAGDLSPKMVVDSTALPEARKGGRKLEGEPDQVAKELVQLLRDEAKVI